MSDFNAQDVLRKVDENHIPADWKVYRARKSYFYEQGFAYAFITVLYSVEGHPAIHPWQLALVSVTQFIENLSDRQASQAVRARIDWRYALGLELSDEGFHFPQERHEMLQAARARQQPPEFHDVYQARCGMEGTFSQTTRNTGMRRARYIGQRKTHLQHLFTALAINILRLVRWLEGIPLAKTRTSSFAALAA